MAQLHKKAPDVVLLSPPVGPFSSWTQASSKELREAKARYWPMWEMIVDVWKQQTARGRLVHLQLPHGATVPDSAELRAMKINYEKLTYGQETDESTEWPDLHRDPTCMAYVDLCMLGHCDPETGKYFKKGVQVETNHPVWSSMLGSPPRCQHPPGQHQEVKGFAVEKGGQLVSRSSVAAKWPEPWCALVLNSANQVLEVRRALPPNLALHQECPGDVEWEAVPVETETSPEGLLRQRLGEVTGDQYDYIYFEGGSGSLSKPLRSTLAKLHVVLGHVSNAKLKRMLHLNGAKDHILDAAGDLRCQICQSVVPPRPTPKAAYDRPTRFNERVVVDVFYVWDAGKAKYAVVHAVDAFALYQVATLMHTARADLVAHFLKNYWVGVFGPPEVLMSDGGSEFAAETEGLLRAYDVFHELVPPAAKWRMGLAERHGAILKLLIMKTIQATTAKGYSETKECVMAATSARNRQMRVGGFSPTQIVLGKDVAIPSSLLSQLEKGHFKYVLNQDLAFADARRRNEQIRQAAEQAFIWADSSETLRRAINSRSRHPRLEMLYEGATVYFYDPPTSRKGLPKRLQDQDAWSGPGVVAAIERREGAIKRVWIRYRNKLKGLPLEYVRLAALEEVEASKVCREALQEVEKELQGSRPDIEEMADPEIEEPGLPLMEFSGDEEEEEEDLTLREPAASSLDDVPAQLHRDAGREMTRQRDAQPPRKKVRFEEAKERTEQHLRRMKAVLERAGGPDRGTSSTAATVASSASGRSQPYPTPTRSSTPDIASHRGRGVLHTSEVWHLEEAIREHRLMLQAARWDVHAAEAERITEELANSVLEKTAEIDEGEANAIYVTEELANSVIEKTAEIDEGKVQAPITGKPRLEFKWNKLDDSWRRAFVQPLKDALDVYIDNCAVEGVPMGQMVSPDHILPSRFVLTNKNEEKSVEKAKLKARWVLAGHLDKEAGRYATEAPTASLVAHNLICYISAQCGWALKYADISAAFLQGEELCDERVVYIRLPKGYPDEVTKHLMKRLGRKTPGGIRADLVRLTKGGFGLSESPRLWYLRLRRGLLELGLRELKLSPGTFVFHWNGSLKGIIAVHVDDLRIAFHPKFEYILQELRKTFSFGEWKTALNETVKFCGRWERQCPTSFKVTVTMDGYAPKLQDPPQRKAGDRSPLTDAEKKWVASVGGQINWMARQGRADLAFGISKVQQMAGARDPETLKALLALVKKARDPYECIFQAMPGGFDQMIFLAVSDASHAAMPKGRSQGGLMILLAPEEILDGDALVNCVMYHSAVLKRVVRSSLAAEISQAAEALEQCDFVRTMMAEILDGKFALAQWRWSASRWKEILVLDSKTGYDVLNSISHGEDKRLAIDIAILKESLYEPESNRWVRWVPGVTMPSDGLTKEYGNHMRDAVMKGGPWSLCDSPQAQKLREEAGHRKRQCRDRARQREHEIEQLRQAADTSAPMGVGVKADI
ncbi:RE1 [Symbiodinium sp. CCMP2592]|nr:RE1 [Symbiodinium sp. CCMP2592]